MKKVLLSLGYVLLLVIAAAAGFAAYVAVTGIPTYAPGHVNVKVEVVPAKVERGWKYASMLCISCHLDPSTGKLTGKRLADVPAVFGEAYSRNITRNPVFGIGSWTTASSLICYAPELPGLVATRLRGCPSTPTCPMTTSNP